MSDRAKKLAMALAARGWDIETHAMKNCPDCGADVFVQSNFCSYCGTRLPIKFSADALDDIESALIEIDKISAQDLAF